MAPRDTRDEHKEHSYDKHCSTCVQKQVDEDDAEVFRQQRRAEAKALAEKMETKRAASGAARPILCCL